MPARSMMLRGNASCAERPFENCAYSQQLQANPKVKPLSGKGAKVYNITM